MKRRFNWVGVRRGGRPTILSASRRRVREDVRLEKKRLNPDRAQRWNCPKLSKVIGRTDQRGLCSMIIAAVRNQCNRASVIRAIPIRVDALVQLR